MTNVTKMVTVRCPNHHRELTRGLWNLRQTNRGLDYEINCGKRSIIAHGVLLQAFLSTSDSTFIAPIDKVYDYPPPSDDLLEFVLEFLYKGTVTLSQDQLDDLQAIGGQLNFRLLVDAVEETKRCKPVDIVIPRVEEMPTFASSEVPKIATEGVRQRVVSARGRPATRKPKLSASEARTESVNSDSSDWQPDSPPKKPAKRRAALKDRSKVSTDRPSIEDQSVTRTCDRCDYETTSTVQLAFHQASKHDSCVPIFRCSKCRAKFTAEAEMQDHCQHCAVRTNPNSQTHKCTLCDYETSSFVGLRKHRFVVHSINAKGNPISLFKCGDCKYSTIYRIRFLRHRHRKHSEVPTKAKSLVCKFCRQTFQSEEPLAEHLINHPKLKCNLCNFEANFITGLNEHRRCIHHIDTKGNPAKEVKCPECDYSTVLRKRLKLHMQLKHTVAQLADGVDKDTAIFKKFKCNMCEYETQNRRNIREHQEGAHRVNDKGISTFTYIRSDRYRRPQLEAEGVEWITRCKFCNKTIKSPEELEKHLVNHETYKCSLCDFEAKRKNQLSRHRILVHSVNISGKPVKKFNCPHCDLKATNRSQLREHMTAIHSGSKPFKCPYCSYSTGWKFVINQHINSVHLGTRPHACDTCDYKATYPSQLREHKFTHTGEKPYKCDLCDAGFCRKNDLTKHRQSHDAAPVPHLCHHCGITFKTSGRLATHMRKVHKDVEWLLKHHVDDSRLHLCHQCGQAFKMSSQLNVHIKKIHMKDLK